MSRRCDPHRQSCRRATSATTWCAIVLAYAGVLPADELRLDARRLLDRSVTCDVRLATEGAGVELERGVLVEDDGPAAGYSYQPNEETLNADTRITKELVIADPRAAQATLLVGPGGELASIVNGVPQTLQLLGKAGNYWQRYALPVDALRAGKNEIVLHGAGKVWIARDDEFAAGSLTRRRHPNRSRKSSDAGRTWSDSQLGPRGDIDGEYYVRMFLDQYRPSGWLRLPVVDVGNLSQSTISPPTPEPGPVQVKVASDCGTAGRVVVRVRSGTTYAPDETHWTDWRPLAAGGGSIETPRGRYLQVMVELATSDALASPRVREVTIAASQPRAAEWQRRVRPVATRNPELARTSVPFEYESFDELALGQLRRERKLDEVVAGVKTEWELICRLAAWSSRQWESGHLAQQYPPWNGNEILKLHADGKPVGGFCQQYNVVLLQACESFGLVGRAVSIGAGDHGVKIRSGHEVVEIWSNDFCKWIYVDGQAAWYFVDRESRTPLSLRELRERQLHALAGRAFPAVDLVRVAETRLVWNDLKGWPAFVELRLIPRSNFLAEPAPLPLHQGMRGWFWTGHWVWNDEQSPASQLYGLRIAQRQNWEWTLNGVHLLLEASESPGELRVHCDTETPGFKCYRAHIKGQEPREVASEFVWKLESGTNQLDVWPVNRADRAGFASQVVLEYTP